MAKIIIPQGYRTLGEDPAVDIEVKVDIRLRWKDRIVQPQVESLRGQLQLAFNDEAKKIEKDLTEIIKRKKSPGFTEGEDDHGSTIKPSV